MNVPSEHLGQQALESYLWGAANAAWRRNRDAEERLLDRFRDYLARLWEAVFPP